MIPPIKSENAQFPNFELKIPVYTVHNIIILVGSSFNEDSAVWAWLHLPRGERVQLHQDWQGRLLRAHHDQVRQKVHLCSCR